MASKRKITFLLILLLIILIAGTASYLLHSRQTRVALAPAETKEQPEKTQLTHAPCLEENEFADSSLDERNLSRRIPKFPVAIFITDKNTKEKKFNFKIDDVKDNIRPLEIHKCGVYAIRNFELDETKSFYKKNEFWHYSYQGEGKLLMSNEEFRPYSFDFRIDPTETYIALVRSYLGQPDYTLVIKNIKTMEDVVSWKLDDLIKEYQIEPGIFTLSGWDERRFGFQVHSQEEPVFNVEKGAWILKKVF